MKAKIKKSIVLYGNKTNRGVPKWWDRYQYALNLTKALDFTPSHVGVIGNSFKSGKVHTISRTEKKIKKSVENKELIENISVYSLPKDFTQAAFDYDTFICMDMSYDHEFILVSLPTESFNKLDINKTILELSEFINYENGEIFEMSVLEAPLFYVSEVNSSTDFNTLRIIEKFTSL